MIHPSTVSRRTRDHQVRESFARAAPGLGLALELPPLDNRMVGVALFPAAHSTVNVHETRVPPKPGPGDGAKITRVLTSWHSLNYADVHQRWQRFAISPYVAVGPSKPFTVNAAYMRKWKTGGALRRLQQRFMPHKRRRFTISKLHIVYLGPCVAAATYFHRETGQDGKTSMGNAAAFLIKKRSAWKIAVISHFGEVS
jgi:hypothetical protein